MRSPRIKPHYLIVWEIPGREVQVCCLNPPLTTMGRTTVPSLCQKPSEGGKRQ